MCCSWQVILRYDGEDAQVDQDGLDTAGPDEGGLAEGWGNEPWEESDDDDRWPIDADAVQEDMEPVANMLLGRVNEVQQLYKLAGGLWPRQSRSLQGLRKPLKLKTLLDVCWQGSA